MSTAIALMPVMDIEAALSRRNAMVEYVQRIMVSGVDYGTIPGTGSKPTLLKPGAEKLSSMFALRPTFPVVEAVQDWTGENHGGEPFFSYWYKCILWRGDEPVGEGDGSCNSWEKKYRYRKAERTCPACGALSIMRSKYPPKNDPNGQPGWYCRDCKAQFPATDPAITAQSLGYVPNTDVADQVNTMQKMAQKRALIAAVLVTCNASEFFTQDLEDIAEGEFHEVDAPAKANGQQTRPSAVQAIVTGIAGIRDARPDQVDSNTGEIVDAPPTPANKQAWEATKQAVTVVDDGQLRRLNQLGVQFYGAKAWDAKRHELVQAVSKGKYDSSKELSAEQADYLISGLERRIEERSKANAAAAEEEHATQVRNTQEALLAEAASANELSSYAQGA